MRRPRICIGDTVFVAVVHERNIGDRASGAAFVGRIGRVDHEYTARGDLLWAVRFTDALYGFYPDEIVVLRRAQRPGGATPRRRQLELPHMGPRVECRRVGGRLRVVASSPGFAPWYVAFPRGLRVHGVAYFVRALRPMRGDYYRSKGPYELAPPISPTLELQP